MTDIAISIQNLSKRYRIGGLESYKTLRESIIDAIKAPFQNLANLRRLTKFEGKNEEDVIWALNGIDLKINEGEILGIIGRNGAGKSTLLKILSRITPPSSGTTVLNGRVSSLLEVGTGFHPELTGRENIFLNGAILGMSIREIKRKFDEIVDFSGVEKFLDTPVKRFSSGMQVRLAFAVAAHLDPDILLIDEVLAVGDIEFQRKCLGKMNEVAYQGRTVMFVSHQMEMIASLCQRCILLNDGMLTMDGSPRDIINAYSAELLKVSQIDLRYRTDRQGKGSVRFTKSWVENDQGIPISSVSSGLPLKFIVLYEISDDLDYDFNFSLTIAKSGMTVSNINNEAIGKSIRLPKSGKIVVNLPKLQLSQGLFTYNLHITSADSGRELEDTITDVGSFTVQNGDYYEANHVSGKDGAIVCLDYQMEVIEEKF